MFFEPHPEGFESGQPPHAPSRMIFAWKETRQRLAAANPDPSGRHGVQVQLGHPALETMALYMMRLAQDAATASFRTTANNVYAVVTGEGSTEVEDQRFSWSRGDVFVVPAWHSHAHRSNNGAVLFRVTDEPVMKKLGFLRNDPA
jgi:gentisate 1,2-dioxygenase